MSEAGAGEGNNLSTPDTAVREEGFIVTVESGGEIDVEEPTHSQDLNTAWQTAWPLIDILLLSICKTIKGFFFSFQALKVSLILKRNLYLQIRRRKEFYK